MTSFKRLFDKISSNIADPSDSEHHHPLMILLELVNKDESRRFDPAALQTAGIDPTEFRKAWSTGFARETLGWRTEGMDKSWRNAAINRCETCLSETEGYKFGEVLPEPLKQAVAERLQTLEELRR